MHRLLISGALDDTQADELLASPARASRHGFVIRMASGDGVSRREERCTNDDARCISSAECQGRACGASACQRQVEIVPY
jgi:hypothetical protein